MAHELLANHYRTFKIKPRAGVDEGVKLGFFAARIDSGRQGGKDVLVKLRSEEFGIESVGINTG